MNYLEAIGKYHPEVIHHFLQTGESKGIPDEIQLFLKQLQWAAEIYEYERNISRCAGSLRLRIMALQGKDVDLRTCKARIYSAIAYFNIDNNVSVKVWETDFADKYEDLAKLAVSSDEYKTAKACLDAARQCRLRASEAAEKEKDWIPVFLLSNDISLQQLGFQKRSLKEIARKSNDGYYIKLIESLPVEEDEKRRLLRDANIEDVEVMDESADGE